MRVVTLSVVRSDRRASGGAGLGGVGPPQIPRPPMEVESNGCELNSLPEVESTGREVPSTPASQRNFEILRDSN